MGDWLRTRYRPRPRRLVLPLVVAAVLIVLAVWVGR